MSGNQLKFHVVNSIKGGAGKSTFSLMLANYYIQKGKKAIVIDLDLQGTSWEDNYKPFFKKPVSNGYINDLMYSFDEFSLDEYERRISVQLLPDGGGLFEKAKEDYCIPVYISSYNITRIDEIQVDLFINAIYRLIVQIYTNFNEEEINIIFDMPPSKDKHAERVLTYLLLDMNSPLRKKCEFDIKLYMMTNITMSHRNKNIEYLRELARNTSYSGNLPKLAEEGSFELFIVMNDLSNIMPNIPNPTSSSMSDVPNPTSSSMPDDPKPTSNMYTNVNKMIDNIPFTNRKKTESFAKVVLLKHIVFMHKQQILNRLCSDKDSTGEIMKISFDSNNSCNDTIEMCNGKI